MKDIIIKVNFSKTPIKPHEWEKCSYLVNPKIIRVLPKVIKDILCYETYIDIKSKTIILSDGINSIALRIGKDRKVILRSYLSLLDETIINDITREMKRSNIKYKTKEKIIANNIHDENIKDYLLKSIDNMEEEKIKYMYFLLFDNIKDYSKEKLIKVISQNNSNKLYKLYNFLVCN